MRNFYTDRYYFVWVDVLLVFGLLFLTGCSLLPGATTRPTDTPTATRPPAATPTSTIVWFPPTKTPTPILTPVLQLPTSDQRPGMGAIAVQDNFTSKTGWQTGQLTGGTVDYGKDKLTLAIQEGVATLISLRSSAIPADFYLEITVASSLCRAKDSFGLVFRADGGVSQYRWILTCEGQMRLERWRPNEVAVPQDWLYTGQMSGGAPFETRLGLWVVHDEMRFFVNNAYQFSARDPLLNGTYFGVFSRSTGLNALTVSFSNLVVRQIESYVPTIIPSPTVYLTAVNTRMPTITPVK